MNAQTGVGADGSVIKTLHPGDVICAERDVCLTTLLGSCVAIILTDRHRTVGAMCHIVHCKPSLGDTDNPGAYADVAVDTLYRLLRRRGFNPHLCEAYVYGGGNMFPEMFKDSHVGQDNCAWAMNRLAQDGIPVLSHDLGGSRYRRLSWIIGFESPQVVAVDVCAGAP